MPSLRRPLRQGRLPGRLPRGSCPFVYSYEAWGHTYVGCMQKVYDGRDRPRHAAAAERSAGRLRRHPGGAPAAADVQGRGRADLRVALRATPGASTRSSASCPSASPTFRVFAQLGTGEAEQPLLAPPANRPRREPDEGAEQRRRDGEREHVDGADPDPAKGDTEVVQRPVAVQHGGRRAAVVIWRRTVACCAVRIGRGAGDAGAVAIWAVRAAMCCCGVVRRGRARQAASRASAARCAGSPSRPAPADPAPRRLADDRAERATAARPPPGRA